MKKKVILYRDIPVEERQRLEAQYDVTFFNSINEDNKGAFIAALADAEGLIGTSTKMSSELLSLAPKLKAASTISVGTDLYDLNYLTERGIPLMHTPGVLNETTADTMFTLIMCAARRAVELSNMVREGRWTSNIGEALYGTDVHGKTLGIIGMGRIGYAIAKRGHFGFDMKIQYSNRSRKQDAEQTLSATYMEMEELLQTSDFVCVMTPLTPETERLIGAKEFAMMKKSAIFINGSRGKVIDEAALVDALSNGTIRAAGLDVFEVEPLSGDSPLCKLDNAVLFPHIGSATAETRLAMITCAVDNLINALNGDISKNCANKHLLNKNG
ncbi:D-glycerate dehydrogenase [Marinomonas sp. UCMA 3892]|uniref:Glyoxylate/hydroxypyruvate reductase B n=1 Tax=Marinomonas sp. (strain MWYL1) TaxID=400668 RepID=A6W1N0_MARMS|nr:D-glycerate dehydrogenase [Marinomonas sp. UCMA 3892]NLU98474.1 D-glycerate dehydrogenase [Marinomonas sp. UCMA 3892]